MRLSLFCNIFIIAEYIRLRRVLAGMPRYMIGTHNGMRVIREYSGYGAGRRVRSAQMNGKGYDEMQRNLELFNNVSERETLF